MRVRNLLLSGLALVGLAAASLPAQAAPKKFEGTIAIGTPIYDVVTGDVVADEFCPDGGPANGINYAWIDMKTEFKKFVLTGPPYLAPVTDPTGTLGSTGEYDIDLHLFDAKCTNVGTHTNDLSGTVKTETRRPARFALIAYYFGPPNLKYTLEAS